MKHNIRINGQEQELDCELGSGILDKNGREIFEGDKVTFKPQKVTVPIVFIEGVWFGIYSPVQRLNLAIYQSKDLEIID